MKRISKSKALKLYKEIRKVRESISELKELKVRLENSVKSIEIYYIGKVATPVFSTALSNVIINKTAVIEELDSDMHYLALDENGMLNKLTENDFPIDGDILTAENLVRLTK